MSTPKADAKYKYYVGRAIDEANENEAWRVAKHQAQESAVRENFGVETSIASSSFESANLVSLDKRVAELFPKVRLVDFEEVDSYVERTKEKVSVWVMYRYAVREIESERERLKVKIASPPQPFNEVGSPSLTYTTTLEVTSEPANVTVYIDDERWGVTPLKVVGTLAPGVHKVKLTHPAYEDVESKVVLTKGSTRRVQHRLAPATGKLVVEVSPRGAEVFVDGVRKKEAKIKVLAERDIRIEVRKVGYETQSQVIKVQKGEERSIEFRLNEIKLTLPSLTQPKEVTMLWSHLPEPAPYQRAWLLGMFFGISEPSAPQPYGLDTIQLGMTLEKRFLWRLGLRAGLSYDGTLTVTKTSERSSESALNGTGVFLGVPIYLSSGQEGFYLMPEVGRIRHQRMKELDPVPTLVVAEYYELTAQRAGLRLGYMNVQKSCDLWLAVHSYDWREYGSVTATSAGVTYTFSDGGL